MMKYLGWISLLALLAMSCGDSAESTDTESETADTNDSTAAQASAGERKYPSVPLDTLTMLYEQCDYIDYVFYYTNFSVNQSDPQAIRSALSHIAEEAPAIKPSCQPVGRLFYQVEGENRLVADLYFDREAGCVYYIFLEDGKPAYANKLMPAGINFMSNLLERAKSLNAQ